MKSTCEVQKLSCGIVVVGKLGLRFIWRFLHVLVSIWYSILALGNKCESFLISSAVLKSYKLCNLGKLHYLAIVIESDDAHQTSKVVELLRWLDSLGVKNVCLYDRIGVIKKSKKAIVQQLKIEEANDADALHGPNHMTIEFASYADGREGMTKAANWIFAQNLKRHSLGDTLDVQHLTEPQLDEALRIVGYGGQEPDLLLVYGPVRCHLGFPAWRIKYTEIVHMGSLNSMRYGSLVKAIYDFTKVHQNYGK
ncbi:dehydrodolichyl diphosphate synthase complex subunit NUS1-like [Neltuma alba]|uniref:dehydrodolichyl diphosphate synthase complex subunit NUS1-like n=1 Tax=Neltuma alba TaxID=207710 RepID=UPI0010A4A571|nr:dehydrodolichyl diphosphate synthase complex subunit NUS1-like [Prosopis alba]XP_028806570.1 dehydrodolichyl diphosphate synthase complex subunit NUS1-like [Prosopis alba]